MLMSLFPPTKPGQRCRVIGGRMPFNDEGQSPNIGKEVTTLQLMGQAGIEQENVWRCQAKEGTSLITYHGGVGDQADFLACWLEVIEETEPPKTTTTEREIATS
jgi:hypothetical protein